MTIERYGIHNVIRFHFLLSFSLLRPFYMDMKNVNGILQQKLNTIQSSMKAKNTKKNFLCRSSFYCLVEQKQKQREKKINARRNKLVSHAYIGFTEV